MKHFISRRNFLKAAGVTAAASAMAAAVPQASAGFLTGKDAAVTILYTNDVHTYIDNKSPKLTYAAIAAMKQGYVDEGKPVLLVDAGDHIQGTAYGSMDDGATIIELMNEAGYDIATLGNHEFDYGMARAKAIIKEADFPYVSCNWVDLRTGLRVLPAVKLFPAGGKWIAFVGITTPESFTKSTPAYFMNAKQTKYIYDILGGDDGRKLYDAVQKAIDKAKALGAGDVLCREKLCPVIAYMTYKTFKEGVAMMEANLEHEGKGHSIAVHSNTPENVEYAAIRCCVSRVVVNQPSGTTGGGSPTNGFTPTTTLGCGTWGNNSFAGNLNYEQFINITRVGYPYDESYLPDTAKAFED